MAFTKQARPATTFSKVARPIRGAAGRYGLGRFGVAKYGTLDSTTKVARPATTFTKQPRA